jgi:hypothetical protein
MSLKSAKNIDASDIAINCIFVHFSIHRAMEHSLMEILQYNILMAGDIAINILLAGDIAIQYVGGGRYWNKYIGGRRYYKAMYCLPQVLQ